MRDAKVPAVKNRIVLSAQWTDMPDEVEEEVSNLWANWELGNDYYYVNIDEEILSDWEADKEYPLLLAYIRENIPDFPKEGILLHWWW